jgi:phosphopantothenoylcysteine decarboxylase/phosphopantothenate--cysteine ligase
VKRPVLVTAGPTREKIDPIRFISNYSTGTFGYEIAREAKARGREVILISGPTCLEAPRGVRRISVESALEMKRAVEHESKKCGCVIMAAAVSDWRVKTQVLTKIKRRGKGKVLELVENPDILAGLRRHKAGKTIVGFALETEDLEKNAVKKLKIKHLDLVVANKLGKQGRAFSNNRTSILMIDKFGDKRAVNNKTKKELAKIILDKALSLNIG